MFEKLGKVSSQIEEVRKRMNEAAQKEVKPALQEAVEQLRQHLPELKKFKWNQYIPGFNDGEPCVFNIGSVSYMLDESAMGKAEAEEDGFVDEWTLKDTDLNDTKQEMLRSLEKHIFDMEDVMENAFGTNSEITVNIDDGTIDVEDYDCGY